MHGKWYEDIVLIMLIMLLPRVCSVSTEGFTKDASWKQAVCFFADLIQVPRDVRKSSAISAECLDS